MARMQIGIQRSSDGLYHLVAMIWNGDNVEVSPVGAAITKKGWNTIEKAAEYGQVAFIPWLRQLTAHFGTIEEMELPCDD